MKLGTLAYALGARLHGSEDIDIRSAAGLREAGPGDISYVSDAKHLADVESSRASAVIIHETMPVPRTPSLAVKNPRFAFAMALRSLYERQREPGGISERAYIGENVWIGEEPTIRPFVVVEDGAKIGNRVTLHPGVFVGSGSVIGDDCTLYSNVSIREGVTIGNRVILHSGTVIGCDGFGFVTDAGVHHKIPQVGGVIVEDDVEMGANCAIDRATLGKTVIKKGTKFDNLVHIAHNVTIGEHCLLAGQVGIAGSSTLGSYVVIGGQAGVGDHRTIGDRVMIGGGSGITQDIAAGGVVAGYYAVPLRDWLKIQAALPYLPDIKKRVSQLEKTILKHTDESDDRNEP